MINTQGCTLYSTMASESDQGFTEQELAPITPPIPHNTKAVLLCTTYHMYP